MTSSPLPSARVRCRPPVAPLPPADTGAHGDNRTAATAPPTSRGVGHFQLPQVGHFRLPLTLSPRVRGNQFSYAPGTEWQRSIPAGAGEPRADGRGSELDRVYPRGCGGTSGLPDHSRNDWGLSPRVRGNLAQVDPAVDRQGSIPAGAGEPIRRGPNQRKVGVYPRGCGGTEYGRPSEPSAAGLSPRVRGNRPAALALGGGRGSIPAGAGEPRALGVRGELVGVYPRGCGGTQAEAREREPARGLSPRVRGNLAQVEPAADRQGSIPAGAGEPDSTVGTLGFPGVYPRGCGGTAHSCLDLQPSSGLSPRVRGNHWHSDGELSHFGSIPAGAGEPSPETFGCATQEVYPRGCGGTLYDARDRAKALGLSPRVRGNHLVADGLLGARGSIPAGAGEPSRSRATCQGWRVYPRGCGGTRRAISLC